MSAAGAHLPALLQALSRTFNFNLNIAAITFALGGALAGMLLTKKPVWIGLAVGAALGIFLWISAGCRPSIPFVGGPG
ncbi:MAG TPA: hypothetical protein VH134_15980 [Candidatus Dormibacteraeota bacterium]|jgi:hypothetical protein|nr:hypothetical protein [Candidatus Dormibacteraeota bacterium]